MAKFIEREIKLVEKKKEVNVQELRDQHLEIDAQQLADRMKINIERAKEILKKEKKQNNP